MLSKHRKGEKQGDPARSVWQRPNCYVGVRTHSHETNHRAEDFSTVYRFLVHSGSGYSPIACCQACIVFGRRGGKKKKKTKKPRDLNITRNRQRMDGGTINPNLQCHIVRVKQAGSGGIRGCFRIVNLRFMVVYPRFNRVSPAFSAGIFPVSSTGAERPSSARVAMNGHGENLDVIAFASSCRSGFQRAAVRHIGFEKHIQGVLCPG